MDGVKTVTNTVTSTASTSVDVAKKAGSDVIQLQFYKNPVFIVFVIYCITIFGTYFNMSSSTKNSYVFSNKFRDKDGKIYWKYILSYPYDMSASTSSMIYSMFTPPIVWYLFFFTVFFSSFIDIRQTYYQAYFYSIMISYFIMLVLFSIHLIIFNFILHPRNTKVELAIGDTTKPAEKTYSAFYRTQWLLLAFLSPIYVCIVVYIMRKLK